MEDYDHGHSIGLGIALGLLIVCSLAGLVGTAAFVLINWPTLALLGTGATVVLTVMMKLSPPPAPAAL